MNRNQKDEKINKNTPKINKIKKKLDQIQNFKDNSIVIPSLKFS